jgi:sporulation protein YlmC with PRC-barrel domain
MPHYGLLRDYHVDDLGASEDIRGSHVYGRNEEKLGKIDDVIFDHSTGAVKYVVVDTGGWFSSRKFLVPPHRLHTSAEQENDFAVNLDKEQTKVFHPTMNRTSNPEKNGRTTTSATRTRGTSAPYSIAKDPTAMLLQRRPRSRPNRDRSASNSPRVNKPR